MEKIKLNVSEQELEHSRLMRSLVQGVADTPLVLKGGTALMFGYGLDRFSEDLDFDASRRLNLEHRIERSVPSGITIKNIARKKDTETVTRYMVEYGSKSGDGKLKVEISYRSAIPESEVNVVDGMRVANISRIFSQKLSAAHDGDRPRVTARDLYDLRFIATSFSSQLHDVDLMRLKEFSSNPDGLVSLYRQAFLEDDLVRGRVTLEELAHDLRYISEKLMNKHILPPSEHCPPTPFVGDLIECRDPSERLDEEVYRSIPALTHFANSAIEVGNKLAADARTALFFDKGSDPELRTLMVENAMMKRDELNSVQPDLEWLRSAAPASRKDFESKDNDAWVTPAPPGQ